MYEKKTYVLVLSRNATPSLRFPNKNCSNSIRNVRRLRQGNTSHRNEKAFGESFKWDSSERGEAAAGEGEGKKIWADHVYYDCISFVNPICERKVFSVPSLDFFLFASRFAGDENGASHIGMQQLYILIRVCGWALKLQCENLFLFLCVLCAC